MILLFLVMGCAARWTESGVLAPTLARLDKDGDGTVSVAEYEKVTFHADPNEHVDANHDGAVSLDELGVHVLSVDPASLTVPRSGPQVVRGKRGKGAKARPVDKPADERRLRSERQWGVRLTLLALRVDIEGVAPQAVLPTDEVLLAASSTASLRTAESRAVLASLEAASDAAGLDFPGSLRAAALAKEPVEPTVLVAEPVLPGAPGSGVPGVPGVPGGPGGAGGPGSPGAWGHDAPGRARGVDPMGARR